MIREKEGWGMITIATTLIVIFLVIILIGTLMVAGKSDPGYGKKAKKYDCDDIRYLPFCNRFSSSWNCCLCIF